MDTISTPWTDEQVTALNAYQREGRFHPFTCGKRDNHNNNDILVATRDGWVCPFPGCGYTQRWAHSFMADTQFRETQLNLFKSINKETDESTGTTAT